MVAPLVVRCTIRTAVRIWPSISKSSATCASLLVWSIYRSHQPVVLVASDRTVEGRT